MYDTANHQQKEERVQLAFVLSHKRNEISAHRIEMLRVSGLAQGINADGYMKLAATSRSFFGICLESCVVRLGHGFHHLLCRFW